MVATDPDEPTVTYRKRRTVELFLLLLAVALGLGAYLLIHLNLDGALPAGWPWVAGGWTGLAVAAHLVVRWRTPYADPWLLPMAFLLTGLGVSMIHRIDLINEPARHDAETQLVWVGLGIACLVGTLLLAGDYRTFQRYPYLLFVAGLVLLLLPLTPLGVELNGSRIWIRLAGYSFQPAEVAKIVLSIAFAGYLAEKRDVLALAGPKVLGLTLPRARDLGPIAIMWAVSLVVLVGQRDLGTSLLFFGLFVAMLYVTTQRPSWVLLGGVLFTAGAFFAYQQFIHVRVRVSSWLDPFSDYQTNYQVIQGQFGFAYGGILGRGWGLGRPGLTPLAKSDFIIAAIGEEMGLVGLMAVIVVYGLVVSRGLRSAITVTEPFGKLLAAGLSFAFALQVFAIVGGVTRLLPLTGLTTPFMSQGGSSMVANWIVLAMLMVISHNGRRPAPLAPATDESGVAVLSGDATQVIPLRPHPQPRPEPPASAQAGAGADAQATQVVPARPGPGADAQATQVVPARPGPGADAQATQVVPARPGAGADAQATQVVPARPGPVGQDAVATQAVPPSRRAQDGAVTQAWPARPAAGPQSPTQAGSWPAQPAGGQTQVPGVPSRPGEGAAASQAWSAVGRPGAGGQAPQGPSAPSRPGPAVQDAVATQAVPQDAVATQAVPQPARPEAGPQTPASQPGSRPVPPSETSDSQSTQVTSPGSTVKRGGER